ncbi:unnamed protein product, partial [marine sediment metagenome]
EHDFQIGMFEIESSAHLDRVGFLKRAWTERLATYSNPVFSIGVVYPIPLEGIQNSGEAVVQAKCTNGSQDRNDAHDLCVLMAFPKLGCKESLVNESCGRKC